MVLLENGLWLERDRVTAIEIALKSDWVLWVKLLEMKIRWNLTNIIAMASNVACFRHRCASRDGFDYIPDTTMIKLLSRCDMLCTNGPTGLLRYRIYGSEGCLPITVCALKILVWICRCFITRSLILISSYVNCILSRCLPRTISDSVRWSWC